MTNTQPEEWRPAVGYEGLYSVSNHGRVRREDRLVERSNQRSMLIKQKVLSPGAGKKAKYLSLRLTRGKAVATTYVHHIVLLAFIGPRPDGLEACHGDGDRQNNSVWNLRWDTRTANHADKRKHGTNPQGERCGMARLTNESVTRLRRRRAEGASFSVLAREFGVTRMTAHRAASKTSWSHIA